MQLKKFSLISLLLILLVGACQIFPPENVETVTREDYVKYWGLSPNGDYLIYGAPRDKGNFLLDLSTGKKHEFECRLDWWDSYLIGCYDYQVLSIIDTKTLVETPLTPIDLTNPSKIDNPEQANELFVKQLLIKADLIYRPEWVTDTIYILAPNYQLNPDKNYAINGLKNLDKLLAEYTVIMIPQNQSSNHHSEETPSPNELYYYDPPFDLLTIFKTDTNEKIAEYSTEKTHLDVLGWATDSSGVYFTEYSVGFIGNDNPKAIYKLKVPNK